MAGRLEIHYQLMGKSKFDRAFNHIEHVPDDFRDVWEQMAMDFWQHESDTFFRGGPGWRPLSPRYKTWKERHYPGMPILVRTGALALSLTSPDEEGSIYEVYPLRLELGTDLKTKNGYTLGTLHQFGSVRVVDHPPRRPPVEITTELRQTWNKRLEMWLREEFAYGGE